MNIKEIERVVASIQESVFKNANSMSAGILRSRIRGAGIQFREHQIYSHGDDVRFIDWKVSARTTNIHLKTFEEDRNVEIAIIVDIGPTMFYGSNDVSKVQVSFELVALLFLIAQKTQDKIRVNILLNNESFEMAPMRGKQGLIAFVKLLEKHEVLHQTGKIDLTKQFKLKDNSEDLILKVIKGQISQRKEVLLLSDFNNIYDFYKIKKIMNSVHFHPFKVVSPIDLMSLKFSVPSRHVRSFGTTKATEMSDVEAAIPTINTSERYLEAFMRRFR
jgi:hypothetical protein